MGNTSKKILRWVIFACVVAAVIALAGRMMILAFHQYLGDLTVDATTTSITLVAAIFYFLVIWIVKKTQTSGNTSTCQPVNLSKTLLFSLFIGLSFFAITNFVIDPWDMYGMDVIQPRVNPSRSLKLNFFSDLEKSPDVIITGTSAAFTISPEYIENELGLTAFNWALDGSEAPEILVLSKYIADKKGDYPQVLILQVPERISKSNYNRMAAELLPYLDFEPMLKEIIMRGMDLVNLSQFSDALYTARYTLLRPDITISGYTFLADGFGDKTEKTFSEAALISQARNLPRCKEIPENLVQGLEGLAEFVASQNSTIIFYVSPFMPEFYGRYLAENNKYNRCHQVIVDYFTALAEENEHIYFLDYTLVEDMNGLGGMEGFYDGAHITPANANLLIDAMSDTILEAYQTAEEMRSAEGGAE